MKTISEWQRQQQQRQKHRDMSLLNFSFHCVLCVLSVPLVASYRFRHASNTHSHTHTEWDMKKACTNWHGMLLFVRLIVSFAKQFNFVVHIADGCLFFSSHRIALFLSFFFLLFSPSRRFLTPPL